MQSRRYDRWGLITSVIWAFCWTRGKGQWLPYGAGYGQDNDYDYRPGSEFAWRAGPGGESVGTFSTGDKKNNKKTNTFFAGSIAGLASLSFWVTLLELNVKEWNC